MQSARKGAQSVRDTLSAIGRLSCFRISTFAHAASAARAGCSSQVLSPCGVILCAPLAAAAV
eukprot:4235864-Prymnesium_polylepis.1